MKPVETELIFQGRTLRQMKRTGMVAIYELRNEGELLLGYEVIKIKVAAAQEVFGKPYPDRETYPSSRKDSPDWGTIAWSFGRNQKIVALAVFNSLVKKERKRATATEYAQSIDDLGALKGNLKETL
jgi:hypothetical protein